VSNIKFRIESKDGMTRVVDAETGREFRCTSLKFEHAEAGATPELTLTIIDFDLEAVLQDVEVSVKGDESPTDRRADLDEWSEAELTREYRPT
jgi:hypothetical protein